MTGTVHAFPAPSRRPRKKRTTGQGALRPVGAILAALVLIAAMVHAAGGEARAVRRLPPEARAALYARTVENLATVCRADGKRSLTDFCHDQAELALAFQECDSACVELARAALRGATR